MWQEVSSGRRPQLSWAQIRNDISRGSQKIIEKKYIDSHAATRSYYLSKVQTTYLTQESQYLKCGGDDTVVTILHV